MRRLAIGRPSGVRRISGSAPRLPINMTLFTEPAIAVSFYAADREDIGPFVVFDGFAAGVILVAGLYQKVGRRVVIGPGVAFDADEEAHNGSLELAIPVSRRNGARALSAIQTTKTEGLEVKPTPSAEMPAYTGNSRREAIAVYVPLSSGRTDQM